MSNNNPLAKWARSRRKRPGSSIAKPLPSFNPRSLTDNPPRAT